MDIFSEIKKDISVNTDKNFLTHAKSEAKKNNKALHKMKVVTHNQYSSIQIIEKILKDGGNFEGIENHFNKRTNLEKKGQAYKGLERKYEVRSVNGMDKKIMALDSKIAQQKKVIEYINSHLENNNFSNIEEMSREIINYKHRIKELEKQLSRNQKEAIDPQLEENAVKYKEVVAYLGTEDVLEKIELLEKLANLPRELSLKQESFILEGDELFAELVHALLTENEYAVRNILTFAHNYLLRWSEYFKDKYIDDNEE